MARSTWAWLGGAVAILVVVAVVLVLLLPRGDEPAVSAVITAPPAAVAATGAGPVGSAQYPVPEGALFVAVSGSDDNPGTEDAPLKTVQQAVTLAVPGQTIVMRAGSYNHRTTITSDKPVTVQPYPGEAVWFDGSVVVDGWRAEGAVWVRDGWNTNFDTSPTYTRGAPDNTEENWSFINPEFPLAAHPDQVWVAGVPLRQVATIAEVAHGGFAVDNAEGRLVIGSDPAAGEVRASTRIKAFGIQAEGAVLRGVGIRAYATSVPQFGAITVEAPGVVIEQVTIEDNAGTGLFVAAADATVTDVTTRRNGMMGFGGSRADRLVVTNLVSEGNNTERFNHAPVSGGAKITRSIDVVVRGSSFVDNFGPGLWFDMSNTDGELYANTISGNAGHGLFLEISSGFAVAGNTISDNERDGIKLNNTDRVEIWNNTITDNGRAMLIAQDDRRGDDPGMAWIVDDVRVSNNVFSGASGKCLVCVEDYSREYTAEQMGVRLEGNVYQRRGDESPAWFIVWAKGDDDPTIFHDLRRFRSVTGGERAGVELPHGEAQDAEWSGSAVSGRVAAAARPIPDEILAALGWTDSVVWIGAAESDVQPAA